ncbi:hypothetical protein [Streptomyces cinereospinus]|uniref:Uncharacterized protein n=1 Tax=Streptomyces cinereospinus TaxID=285561 RepID=A0ABV5N1Y8_9ACTN
MVLFQGQPGPAAHRPGDLAQAAGEALVLQDQRGGLGDVVQPPRVGVVPVAALLEHPEEERGDGDQPVPFGLPDVDRPPDQPDRPVPARRVAPRARPLVQQPPEAVEEHRGEPLHVLGAGEQSVQLDLGRGGLRLVLPAGPEQEADEGAADPRLPRPGRLVAGALPGLQQRGAELLAGLLQRGPVGGDPAVHHEGEAVAVADQRQIAGGQRGVEHGPVVGGGGRGVRRHPVQLAPLQVQEAARLGQVDRVPAARLQRRGGRLVPAQRLVEQVQALPGGSLALRVALSGAGREQPRAQVPHEGAVGVVGGQCGGALGEQLPDHVDEFGARLDVVLQGPDVPERHAPGPPVRVVAGPAEGQLERLGGQLQVAGVVRQDVQPVAQLAGQRAQGGRVRVVGGGRGEGVEGLLAPCAQLVDQVLGVVSGHGAGFPGSRPVSGRTGAGCPGWRPVSGRTG